MGFFSRLFGKKEEQTPVTNIHTEKTEKTDWEDVSGVPQELAASEVLELYNGDDRPVLLDVRMQQELDQSGYIPGSVHIPMEEIEGRLGELDPSKPIIVYCASGMRSMDTGAFLLERGFKSVSNLNGGLNGWTGPLEKPGE